MPGALYGLKAAERKAVSGMLARSAWRVQRHAAGAHGGCSVTLPERMAGAASRCQPRMPGALYGLKAAERKAVSGMLARSAWRVQRHAAGAGVGYPMSTS
jgi:hypothetical protein